MLFLAKADTFHVTFLHDQGYAFDDGLKNFKRFTFSYLALTMTFSKGGIARKRGVVVGGGFLVVEGEQTVCQTKL